ncbi:MAG: hypothetical protein Q9168_003643 [Polycauliona sp. 1 TL-2023]
MARVYSIEFLLKLRPKAMQHPFRQPLNPPEATLIQKHAGFARFLKQHASPPHHRVTAGGRIVPAGPMSPPPFQLLPSINAVIGNPTKGTTKPKTPSAAAATPLAQENVNIPRATQPQVPLVNQFGTNLGPLPAGATPIGFLLDGSPLVYFDGVNYQCYWDGTSTILKPLQLSLPQMPYSAPAYPPMAFGPQFYGSHGSIATGYPHDAFNSLQFTDGINDAREQPQQPDMTSSQNLVFLHSQLSAQLMSLDKYVALHLHEFSAAENANCTAMRRQLVEQLDSLRTSKGVYHRSNLNGRMSGYPGAAAPGPPTNGFTEHRHFSRRVPSNTNNGAVYPITPVASSLATKHGYNGELNDRSMPPLKFRKCLSPDAPPFVPGATAIPTDHTDVNPRIKPTAALNGERQEQRQQVGVWKPLQKSQMGLGKPSIDHSSSDDAEAATPQVSMSEIEYASTPGFNPPGAPKVYCTAASEFQEVIRRVREQAQLYGCKGGQSKDPAYDAEQDVRWAMADGEPIPLPRSPADHVAQPRPWSWDDSTFNCRRQAAISSLWAKDNAEHETLQQSTDSTSSTSRSGADSWFTKSQRPSDYRSVLYGARSHNLCDSPTESVHLSSSKDVKTMVRRQFEQPSHPDKPTSGESIKSSNAKDRENDALSFDSQGIPYAEAYDGGSFGRSKPKPVRVNLPVARSQASSSGVAEESRSEDVGSVHFVSLPSDKRSHGFLRGLLKSPRYSAGRWHKSEPFSHEAPSKRVANKENVRSEEHDPSLRGYERELSRKIPESWMLRHRALPEMFAHKAQSSLAASSYYAVGSHSNHL